MRPLYGRLLKFKRSKLRFLQNVRSMLKMLTPVVQVHFQPFRRNSLLKCVSQPEIAKHQ